MLTYKIFSTQQQYVDAIINVITKVEGVIPHVKNIEDGKATIGYGYTFNRDNNVAIWKELGISLSNNDWVLLQQIDNADPSNKTDIALNFSKTLTNEEAISLIKYSYQEYERQAVALNMPESWERVALVSLSYIGAIWGDFKQGLSLAININNRAESWYQIRYEATQNLNSKFTEGWVKRHYYEAEVFGLYNNPANPTESEAKQVLQIEYRAPSPYFID